jgi:hypothetical protein
MNKSNIMHTEKIQQNLSLNLKTSSGHTENFRVVSSKVEVYDLKFTKNLGISELTPYFAISVGKDEKKTSLPKERSGLYYTYHEVSLKIIHSNRS